MLKKLEAFEGRYRKVQPSKNIQVSIKERRKQTFKMTGFEVQRSKQEGFGDLGELGNNVRLEEKVDLQREEIFQVLGDDMD